jgi:dUTP pyrophosphatase
MSVTLSFAKLTENAFIPVKSSAGSVGFDLRSPRDGVVKAHQNELIHTNLKIRLPNGCYGRIASRSGIAYRNNTIVIGGVIDPDYKGNVGVVLTNLSDDDFIFHRGDKIAQLILEKYVAVDSLYDLTLNDYVTYEEPPIRGVGGFGSTGN